MRSLGSSQSTCPSVSFKCSLGRPSRNSTARTSPLRTTDTRWKGDIICDLNETPSLRKVPVERLLCDLIEDGGPLLYHCDSEEQQRSFDATCRKFQRFLPQP